MPRGLLLDLDGVFFVGDRAVPGGADAVAWAQDAGVRHLFVTNTTSHPRSYLAAKLQRLGVAADVQQILSPAVAAHEWLTERTLAPVALFVPDATAAEFGNLPRLDPRAERGAAAVVVGDLGQAWSFATLNRAFRLLTAGRPEAGRPEAGRPEAGRPEAGRPEAGRLAPSLVALGMARYWKDADGLHLDNGPFVQALAFASGAEPVVTGKPAAAFFHAAVRRLGCVPEDVVMVGDDIHGDVGGAQRAGLRGVLVQTGKYRPSDLSQGVTPDAVLASVADLPAWWG